MTCSHILFYVFFLDLYLLCLLFDFFSLKLYFIRIILYLYSPFFCFFIYSSTYLPASFGYGFVSGELAFSLFLSFSSFSLLLDCHFALLFFYIYRQAFYLGIVHGC